MKLTTPVNDSDHVRGKKNVSVTLAEYGDLECPDCRDAYPVVKEVQRLEAEKLRVAFRHFPLSQIHPHALHAAYAAEAAAKQGKFWEMQELLLENQKTLEDEDLIAYAKGLNLDIQQFKKDILSEKTAKKVRDDFMSGVRSGVNGTPTFFINGIRFDKPCEVDLLQKAVELASEHKGKGGVTNESE